jgi:retron-type reverse transcriptase
VLSGTSTPQPVQRVESPTPDGGVSKLGSPTGLDRVIPHALVHVLHAQGDASCSAHRYGCRPHRAAPHAVAQAQPDIAAGERGVVERDREQCVDRVNHAHLRGTLAKRRPDKRLLQRIRGVLPAGGLAGGWGSPTAEGTPPGGPRSPL